jgi:hypothetical protein
MIAPRNLPPAYVAWNRRWHAPYGRDLRGARHLRRYAPRLAWKTLGPFAAQGNNDTRTFEYPWAFFATPLKSGMRAMDIGGSLAGFQVALDKAGLEVHNIDPGLEAAGVGWPVDQTSIATMNTLFGTHVSLHHCTIDNAHLAADSFERAFCVSVLEHLTPDEFAVTLDCVWQALTMGGLFVITADLFLDLCPFTRRTTNEWGTNAPIGQWIARPGWTLVTGTATELYGSPTFEAQRIQERLSEYFVGRYYPVLTQCLVLQKVPK